MKHFLLVILGCCICALIYLIYKEEISIVEFKDTSLPVKGKTWQKVRQDGYECRVLELEHGWLVFDHGVAFVPKPTKQ